MDLIIGILCIYIHTLRSLRIPTVTTIGFSLLTGILLVQSSSGSYADVNIGVVIGILGVLIFLKYWLYNLLARKVIGSHPNVTIKGLFYTGYGIAIAVDSISLIAGRFAFIL